MPLPNGGLGPSLGTIVLWLDVGALQTLVAVAQEAKEKRVAHARHIKGALGDLGSFGGFFV